ncbi:MAG TPA: F420-0--gamma-glutamyl ligase [Candidatus Merdivicinus faecavium]|nr:F420-0--gamma-glutamyl ligase [Candidatus Merdivicinus faecavium]
MNDSPSFLKVNPEKEEFVTAGGRTFACYAIVTEVVTGKTDLTAFLLHYAAPLLREGDILLLSEKLVACAQGKARPVESIRPGSLARFLCRFVRKTDYGIGLSIPETMQCALDECGAPRILLAAAVGAAGRLLGKSGWFYRVAGYRAAAVDGPCPFTIPPLDRCVVPAPDRPVETARKLAEALGCAVLIIDCNDFGGRILGSSDPRLDERLLLTLLAQNPLGQSREQTPVGILRPCPQRGRLDCGAAGVLQ